MKQSPWEAVSRLAGQEIPCILREPDVDPPLGHALETVLKSVPEILIPALQFLCCRVRTAFAFAFHGRVFCSVNQRWGNCHGKVAVACWPKKCLVVISQDQAATWRKCSRSADLSCGLQSLCEERNKKKSTWRSQWNKIKADQTVKPRLPHTSEFSNFPSCIWRPYTTQNYNFTYRLMRIWSRILILTKRRTYNEVIWEQDAILASACRTQEKYEKISG
jgi:hypothetical protein